jgi:uncharacterized membrane protein (Fun14 family)
MKYKPGRGGTVDIGIILVALGVAIGYSLAASRPVALEVLSIATIMVILAQHLVIRWQRRPLNDADPNRNASVE